MKALAAAKPKRACRILDGNGTAYKPGRHAEAPYNDTIFVRTIHDRSEVVPTEAE